MQGNAQLTSGSIVGGNTVVCGSLSHSSFSFKLVQSCDAFDFAATNAFLDGFMAAFSQSPTTPYSCSSGSCTLTGTVGSEINTFYLSGTTVASMSSLTIHSGADTFVIINVDGASNAMANFTVGLEGGIDNQHVIFNFYETTSLTISGVTVQVGRVLFVLTQLLAQSIHCRELLLLPVLPSPSAAPRSTGRYSWAP